MRRRYVASMSVLRRYDVMCLLGVYGVHVPIICIAFGHCYFAVWLLFLNVSSERDIKNMLVIF